jgi:thymidylate kinase
MAPAGNVLAPSPAPSANSNGGEPPCPRESPLLRELIRQLDAEGVRYCRWKGHWDFQRVISGEGDLDLLVDRKDVGTFQAILYRLGFKRACDLLWPHLPGMVHFYGLEPATGVLIHLHINYQMLAGESLLKNYSLPLEELVLQHITRREEVGLPEGMPVVQPQAELIVFVLRMMLKYSTPTEYFLIRGNNATLRAKLQTLLGEGSVAQSRELLKHWLPCVPPDLFSACLESLREDTSWLRRFRLARKLRRRLRTYSRFPAPLVGLLRLQVLTTGACWRLVHGRTSRKEPTSGGRVIAFIGPEASGKSTLVSETTRWLGKAFRVYSGHLGKPPSTWLTLLPNLAGRLLLRLAPGLKAPAGPGGPGAGTPRCPGLLRRLRGVLVAWDRRALAVRLARKAANGWLVICDRYPSAVPGAADSAQPGPAEGEGRLATYLARLENLLYREIPPPDLVIRLSAPLEVAVARNRGRQKAKPEPDDYVLRRHGSFVPAVFANARAFELDTNKSKAETLQELRRILWEAL